MLVCRANERTPLPDRQPEIVWRAGLDLNPVDVRSPDAVSWLEALVWPDDATLVVFHTAVLAYVSDVSERDAFGAEVASIGGRWISNEGGDVLTVARGGRDEPWPTGEFVLTLDREPVARTDPHGTWIEWL